MPCQRACVANPGAQKVAAPRGRQSLPVHDRLSSSANPGRYGALLVHEDFVFLPSHTVPMLGRGVGRVRELEKEWNFK